MEEQCESKYFHRTEFKVFQWNWGCGPSGHLVHRPNMTYHFFEATRIKRIGFSFFFFFKLIDFFFNPLKNLSKVAGKTDAKAKSKQDDLMEIRQQV